MRVPCDLSKTNPEHMKNKISYITKTTLMAATIFLFGCEQKYNADIIIKNSYIVTMDNEMSEYGKGSLVIKDGNIVAIGENKDIEKQYHAPEVIDGTNKLIMPGLINTHTHAAMTMFRGYADDIHLQDWLYEHIFPIEQEFVTAENVTLSAKLAVAEMLRSGTTTFNDMYYFVDETAKVVDKAGIRAVLTKGLIDFPVPNSPTPEKGMQKTIKLIEKWNDHPRITIGVAAHAPYSCSPELIVNAKKIADKYDVPFNIHVAETLTEFETIKNEYGLSPVAYLNSLGVLDEKVIAAHCVHLTPEDILLIAEKGVGVAHNPQCNMKIASGVAPIPELMAAGAKVGIGTDGPASNNDLDMFDEMRTAAFLHKLNSNNPTVMDAQTIVKLATTGGAKVLGLEGQIGSLEMGKKADIIILDMKKPHAHPRYNIYSLIVYSLKSSDVETVIVDGKIVMKKRDIINFCENEIFARMDSLATEINNRTKELAILMNINKNNK